MESKASSSALILYNFFAGPWSIRRFKCTAHIFIIVRCTLYTYTYVYKSKDCSSSKDNTKFSSNKSILTTILKMHHASNLYKLKMIIKTGKRQIILSQCSSLWIFESEIHIFFGNLDFDKFTDDFWVSWRFNSFAIVVGNSVTGTCEWRSHPAIHFPHTVWLNDMNSKNRSSQYYWMCYGVFARTNHQSMEIGI